MLLLDDDDDGDTSLYQYDANGRLTIVGSLGGDARSYNYDALGNLLTVASTANTLTPPSTGSAGTPPSITGVNPTGGGAGTSVTVSGSGFLPIAGQTVVSFGGTIVTPSTLTDSQFVFAVPAGQGTAPIRIITPFGSAASGNFNVPISGVTLTNTVALTTGGSAQTLTLSAANTSAAFSFSGQTNSWVSMHLSTLATNPSGASVSYTIYGPANQSIATGTVSSTAMSVHVPPLPATGTYLIVFNSGNNTNVSITAAISVDLQVALGSSLSAGIALAGQTQRVQFLGVAGQTFVLDAALQSISVVGASLSATDITPAGSLRNVLGTTAVGNTISAVRLKNYSGGVLLSLSSNATGSVSVLLDQSGGPTITLDGSPLSVAQSSPGKAYRISTNNLPAGQSFVLGLTSLNSAMTVYVLDSLQNYNYQFSCSPSSCNSYIFSALISGVETIIFVPTNSAATYAASITLTTSPVFFNLSQGQETYVNITRPGQTQTFNIPAGGSQALLDIYNVNPSQANGDFSTQISRSNVSYTDHTTGAKLFFAVTSSSTSLAITPKDSVKDIYGGDTGSLKLFLDQSVTNLTMNPTGTSNPVSATVGNSNPEGGVMLSFNFLGTSSANLNLSNISVSGNQPIGVEVFYHGANGWFPSGQQYYCQSPYSNCSYYVPNADSPQNNGPARVVLYPATYPPTSSPYSFGTDGWSVIPITAYASFSAKVSVSQ